MSVALTIYSDGGSRGNPGPSAGAFVVFRNKELVCQRAKYVGKTTNNVAEYEAVILALTWLSKQKMDDKTAIDYYLDSELVVKQLTGIYKVKDSKLKALVAQIRSLEKEIGVVINYLAIPRAKNKLADFLVNKELDKKH